MNNQATHTPTIEELAEALRHEGQIRAIDAGFDAGHAYMHLSAVARGVLIRYDIARATGGAA